MTDVPAPKVSVVVPCFNHAAFVGEAIASALAQTERDIEVIAIDDASTDGTPDVLRGFEDPRLSVFASAKNAGAHATIRAGIERARAPWVTILNSDDVFEPRRIERLLARARAEDADVLGTDITLIDRTGAVISGEDHYWNRWFGGLKAHLAAHGDLRRTLFTGNLFITTSNLFFSRRAYDSIGPFADLRYTHDYDWVLRAIDRGARVVFAPDERTLRYRLHGANTILESPVAASRETMDVLLGAMPMLAGEPDRAVFEELARHLARLERDVAAVHDRTAKEQVVVLARQARRAIDRLRVRLSGARASRRGPAGRA